MAIRLWHGFAVYGYFALWLHDCIAIWLDGYVAMQLCHGMAVYGYMTITCNAAISACRIGREWPRTLDVLGVMVRSSIQIDTITCNAAVSACEKGGERAHALDFLGNMARAFLVILADHIVRAPPKDYNRLIVIVPRMPSCDRSDNVIS